MTPRPRATRRARVSAHGLSSRTSGKVTFLTLSTARTLTVPLPQGTVTGDESTGRLDGPGTTSIVVQGCAGSPYLIWNRAV